MQHDNNYNLDLIKTQLGMGSEVSAAQRAARAVKSSDTSKMTDAEKKRWKASLDFESMFLGQMYKAMRQSDTFGSEITEASPGRQIFTEMLDQEYAQMHSKSPVEAGTEGMRRAMSGVSNSLAAQIYRTLTRNGQDAIPSGNATKDYSNLFNAPATGDDVADGFSAAPGLARILGARNPKSLNAKALPAMSDADLDPIVDLASKTYGVSRALIKSVVKQESDNRPQAVSLAGAKGLMQLMDSTARDMGVRNVFNARENVLAGTRYLKQLMDRYGDEKLALAAYNAGPAQVDRYKGMPPFAETKDYVERILKNKSALEAAAKAK
jgi:Rod binding domain-containing protein